MTPVESHQEAGDVDYTVILPESDVIALARGEVTASVQNCAISCLKAMHSAPEWFLTPVAAPAAPTKRRRGKVA